MPSAKQASRWSILPTATADRVQNLRLIQFIASRGIGKVKWWKRSPLYPTVIEVEAGELLWADLRFEQRVFAIQSGIFVCMSNLEQGREVPLALFGRGYSTGMAELYIAREIAST